MPELPYRILSLDGGGRWALIQVRALSQIFDVNLPGRQILGHFDLVVANSGGSLVMAALASNYTLAQVVALLFDQAVIDAIFVKKLDYALAKKVGVLPRYVAAEKLDGIRAALNRMPGAPGDMTLQEVAGLLRPPGSGRTDLVVATFDFDLQRAVLLRSNSESMAKSSTPLLFPSLAQTVHASSNAPVIFFDAPAIVTCPDSSPLGGPQTRRFWDGGIAGMNNPVLVAVDEALANGISRECMRVISIGTGRVQVPVSTETPQPRFTRSPDTPGLRNSAMEVAESILDDPPDLASLSAHLVLGGTVPTAAAPAPIAGRILRLNPMVQPMWDAAGQEWTWPTGSPDYPDFDFLKDLDMDATEPGDIEKIDALAQAWIRREVPNQPIRAGANFVCEIGEDLFPPIATIGRYI